MSPVPFGRVVELIGDKATGESFRIGLEAIESHTGNLTAAPVTEYQGGGIKFGVGDVLFGKLRPYLAKAWQADVAGAAVGDFHVYRARDGVLAPAFLRWVVLSRAFLDAVESSVFGAKMPRASWDFVRTVEIHLPSLSTQLAIADYLNRETAQIGALIAEQQRLIEMLGERREALIVEAIVSGDNDDVPTVVDERVWLARRPQHWEPQRLSRIATLHGASALDSDDVSDEGQAPYYKVSSLNNLDARGYVNPPGEFVASGVAHVPPGSLVFPKRGAAIFTNKVGMAASNCAIDTNLMALTVDDEVASARFVTYWLKARRLDELADTTAVPQINNKHIYPLHIALPDLKEQNCIVAELDDEGKKIDQLIDETKRFIELSRERRSALITAAVTGQIDVRDLSAADGAPR